MSNDEILVEIETLTADAVNRGDTFIFFVWDHGLVEAIEGLIPYADPNFICRIHIDKVRHGLTWRIREKIGWRLDTLRQRGIIQ